MCRMHTSNTSNERKQLKLIKKISYNYRHKKVSIWDYYFAKCCLYTRVYTSTHTHLCLPCFACFTLINYIVVVMMMMIVVIMMMNRERATGKIYTHTGEHEEEKQGRAHMGNLFKCLIVQVELPLLIQLSFDEILIRNI